MSPAKRCKNREKSLRVKELLKEDINLPITVNCNYCLERRLPAHVYGQKNKSQGHKEVIFGDHRHI